MSHPFHGHAPCRGVERFSCPHFLLVIHPPNMKNKSDLEVPNVNPSNTKPFKLGFLAGVLNRGLGLIGIAGRGRQWTCHHVRRSPCTGGSRECDNGFCRTRCWSGSVFFNGDLGGNTAGLSGNSHQMHPNPSKSWFIIITFPVSQADASEVVGKAAELLRREENMVKLQVWTAGYGSRPWKSPIVELQ